MRMVRLRQISQRIVIHVLVVFGFIMVGAACFATDACADELPLDVMVDTEIKLSIDRSDSYNPVISGEGDIYCTSEDAYSHKLVSVKLPDTYSIKTPDGVIQAPSGTKVTYKGDMNARQGYENYKAVNGIDGTKTADIYMGKISVSIPMTDELLDHGAGSYSVSIPVTLGSYKAYGSYSNTYEFKSWDQMIDDKEIEIKATDTGDVVLSKITRDDMILDIDPSINVIQAGFGGLSYKEVVFPKNLTGTDYSGDLTPFENSNVRKAVFESSILKIPAGIFEDCVTLEEAVIPESVNYFEENCFNNCTKLNKITIPLEVTLGSKCFSNCKGLNELHISDGTRLNINNRDQAPFSGSGIKKIVVEDGTIAIPEFICAGCSEAEEIYMPDSLKKIGREAFYDCMSVKEIRVPDTVTFIGDEAFHGCMSATDIVLPASDASIGLMCFDAARSLKSINIRGNYKVGAYGYISATFYGAGIEKIVVEDGVTVIDTYMFYNAERQLKEIYIPKSLTSIKNSMRALPDVSYTIYYEGTEEEWQSIDGHNNFYPTQIVYTYNSSSAKVSIIDDTESTEDVGEVSDDTVIAEESTQGTDTGIIEENTQGDYSAETDVNNVQTEDTGIIESSPAADPEPVMVTDSFTESVEEVAV